MIELTPDERAKQQAKGRLAEARRAFTSCMRGELKQIKSAVGKKMPKSDRQALTRKKKLLKLELYPKASNTRKI